MLSYHVMAVCVYLKLLVREVQVAAHEHLKEFPQNNNTTAFCLVSLTLPRNTEHRFSTAAMLWVCGSSCAKQGACLWLVFSPPLTRRSRACFRQRRGFRDRQANLGGPADVSATTGVTPSRKYLDQSDDSAASLRHICAPEGLGLIVSDRRGGGLSALHMLLRHYSGDKIPANESKCLSWWGRLTIRNRSALSV